jgi:hypothetical protein
MSALIHALLAALAIHWGAAAQTVTPAAPASATVAHAAPATGSTGHVSRPAPAPAPARTSPMTTPAPAPASPSPDRAEPPHDGIGVPPGVQCPAHPQMSDDPAYDHCPILAG